MWCVLLTWILSIGPLFGTLSDTERVAAFNALVAKDSKQIPSDLLHWLDEQEVPLEPQAITGNYETIKEMVRKISKHLKKPSEVGSREENRIKNAHRKFPAIDETRALRHIERFYLSANDVLTPLQEYIIGQGPLEITIADFWRGILEAKVNTIVALAMPFDAGGRNPPYWERNRFPLSIYGWTVFPLEEKVMDASEAIPAQKIVRRIFQATSEATGETRMINHIHYENWPDNGAPDPLLFHRFLKLVTKIHPVSSSPLFVHCSAGIGRSGTFVTAHSLCKEIQILHPATINIPKRIVELRMQRPYLVSTTIQFEAIYEAVKNCVQEIENTKQVATTELVTH